MNELTLLEKKVLAIIGDGWTFIRPLYTILHIKRDHGISLNKFRTILREMEGKGLLEEIQDDCPYWRKKNDSGTRVTKQS